MFLAKADTGVATGSIVRLQVNVCALGEFSGESAAQHCDRCAGGRRIVVGRRPRLLRAHLREPLTIPYRGGNVYATPELACGPTLAHTLRMLQESLSPGRVGPDAAPYAAYAVALQSAYRERLQDMGDADGRRATGAKRLAPACTTHFSAVEREGNMAAVTQTQLWTFGSKYVLPQTGVIPRTTASWSRP